MEKNGEADARVNLEQWRAIFEKDQAFDEVFCYGDVRTGIFCRPSCTAKQPKFNQIEVFSTAGEALEHGYRPCRRCHPAGQDVTDEEWMEQIEIYIQKHLTEPLSLKRIAFECHGTTRELQQLFQMKGERTVMDYVQEARIRASLQLYRPDRLIQDIAREMGYPKPSGYTADFKQVMGITPTRYKQRLFS